MKIADLFVELHADVGAIPGEVKNAFSKAQSQSINVSAAIDDSKLKAFQQQVSGLDSETIKIDADTSAAEGAIKELGNSVKEAGDTGSAGLLSSFEGLGPKMGGVGTSLGVGAGSGIVEGIAPKIEALGSKAGPWGAVAVGAVAAFAGVGALIAKQIFDGIEFNSSRFDFQAATGLSSPIAAKFGRAAGEAYAQNFGASVADNLDTAKVALQSGLLDPKDTEQTVTTVVSQLSQISDTLGLDIPEAAKAAGQMLKTGLAKNAQDAFDIIVKGTQEGLNLNGDLLDTFNEYGTQFRKLGLDGGEALSLINDLVKGGARDTDLAADALKEFSIRAIDGSKSTTSAFEALGLSAQDMTKKFAEGGPTAKKAFATVVEAIQKVENPVARARIQTELFGTQAEDLGKALNNLDPSKMEKTAGATQKLVNTISKDPARAIEQAQRQIGAASDQIKGSLAQAFAPLIKDFANWVSSHRADILSFFKAMTDGALNFAIAITKISGPILIVQGNIDKFIGSTISNLSELQLKALDTGKTLAEAFGAATGGPVGAKVAGKAFEAVTNGMRDGAETGKVLGDVLVKTGDGLIKVGNGAVKASAGLEKVKKNFDKQSDLAITSAKLADSTHVLTTRVTAADKAAEKLAGHVKGYSAALKIASNRNTEVGGEVVRVNKAFADQVKAAQASGASTKTLNSLYKNYQGQLQGVFEKMGLNKKQAGELADKLGVLGRTNSTPNVDLQGAADAIRHAHEVAAALAALHDRTVFIRAERVTGPGGGQGRHAAGGYINGPGTPTSDSIPARLSDGEFVMRAAAVQKYGIDAMERMNAMRFAGGGAVSGGKRKVFGEATIRDLANGIKGAIDGSELYKKLLPVIKKNLHGAVEKKFLDRLDRLHDVAKKQLQNTKDIEEARSKLSDLRDNKKSFASDFASTNSANILAFANTSGGILGGLQGQLGAFKKFAANLQALRKLYPAELVQQVAAAGLEAGLPASEALLTAAKNGQAGSISSTFKKINTLAGSQGKLLSDQFFDAGIKVAEGALAGFKEQKDKIDERLRNMGKMIAHGLFEELNLKVHKGKGKGKATHDQGGWLDVGRTLTVNNTGKPEAVLNPQQWANMERLVSALETQNRQGGGHGGSAPLIGHAVIRETVDLEMYERRRAFRDRMTNVRG